jgi:hypothetical protein
VYYRLIITTEINSMERKMIELAVLEQIMLRLDQIEKRLTSMEVQTGRMDNHISFIERVYETLRSPLNFFMRITHSTIGIQEGVTTKGESGVLPVLDAQKN